MNLYTWIIAALILLLLLWLAFIYNGFVKARNRVKTQWAQIDVQLTRRADLIPNLVECVKGYAGHEKQALQQVIAARNNLVQAANPAEAIAANRQLSIALPQLFAVAEAYPDLKANAQFLQLQSELKNTEDKIAYARQFYNDTVLLYRDRTGQFPRVIFAKAFGFGQEDFFVADDRRNVDVKL